MEMTKITDVSKLDLPRSIFRAYDIRGVYQESLTTDIVYHVGRALGTRVKREGKHAVITARDGRNSSPVLAIALQQGIMSTGCDVIDVGRVPTPLMYFATKILPSDCGVMVTGSHNPGHYNGLKMLMHGKSLTESQIIDLYEQIKANDFEHGHGEYDSIDIADHYLTKVIENVSLNKNLKVVVDCANGVTGALAPKLLKALNCELIELHTEIDGDFPNHDPDPSDENNLKELIAAVKKHHADIGLAFDGDGDRLGVITNSGQIIWPDRQLMLYAKAVLQQSPNRPIIFDIKCTSHLNDVIKQYGGQPIMWKTGHSLVKSKMLEVDAALAGEMSGHIFFNDRWYGFDDGLYTAARLLEIIAADERDTTSIFSDFPDSVNTPELKIAVSDESKFTLIDQFCQQASFANAQVTTIDGMRVDFSDGWGLVRASNTTPNIVLRFEANNETALERIKREFKDQLLALDGNLVIAF